MGKHLDMTDRVLLLTASIDTKGRAMTLRSDPLLRLDDYKTALLKWLAEPGLEKIVFCENSGYDLESLKNLSVSHNRLGKEIEFISFHGQSFPPDLGKGYGEMRILAHACQASRLITDTCMVVKATGRYYVENISALLGGMDGGADIVCNLTRNLSYADSRLFFARKAFFERYLLPMQEMINDSQGLYFEHAFARAAHKAMGDGMRWSLFPCLPEIVGISGTENVSYRLPLWRRVLEKRYFQWKRFVFRRWRT